MTLDRGSVRFARRHRVPVVASVNLDHYLVWPDPLAARERDLARVLDLGVRALQIDSAYEPYLLGHPSRAPVGSPAD